MKQISLITAFILTSSLVLAAEHGESAGLDEHQIKTIIYQTINFVILFGGLVYFLRNPVKNYFKSRQMVFVEAAEVAQKLRQQAEQQRMEIQVRLKKLESTADESISRARSEAADLKKQLVAEAEALSKKIKDETESTARIEIEKAKNQVRGQMIKEAILLAQNQLTQKITSEDQKRLQHEFIDNIQVVQP